MSAGLDEVIGRLVRGRFPALYLLVDGEDRVVEANEQTRQLLGPGLAAGRFQQLVAEGPRRRPARELAAAGAEPRLVDFLTFTGLPQSYWCAFQAVEEGTLVLGGVDPAEQEAMRGQLLKANMALSERTRALQQATAALTWTDHQKDLFIAMAAHDLRSPVSAIEAYASTLLAELGPGQEEQRHDLAAIRSAAAAMRRVVATFLDASLAEAGRLRVERRPLALSAVAAAAVDQVRPEAVEKGIGLRLEADPAAPPFPVDGALLQQVLVNLLVNGVHHSTPPDEVALAIEVDAGGPRIAVTNRGAGFSPAVSANLFEAYGAGGGKTGGERSIGLGLAVARLVVEAHGGQLSADAPAPGLTRVTVRLPPAAPDGNSAAPPAPR